MSAVINLVGQRFGKLTVVRRVCNDDSGGSRWLCHCDCGVEREIASHNLRTGHTASCGCAHARHGETRHGGWQSAEYTAWHNMITRSTNAKLPQWKDYGGRGITVCERWLGEHGFENFLADVGRKPSPELTLDRIDNDGNYEPGNVRWTTHHDQQMNRRKRVKR